MTLHELATLQQAALARGITLVELDPGEYMLAMGGAHRVAEGAEELRQALRRMGVEAPEEKA